MKKPLAALCLCLLIATLAAAQTSLDPAALEKAFLNWYKTAPRADVNPFDAYRDQLLKDGANPQEANQIPALLRTLRLTRPALAEAIFDWTYSRPVLGANINSKPNALLAQTVKVVQAT